MTDNIRSVCILRLSAIGDVCNAAAAVQAIQRQYPAARITWIIGKIEARLLEGMPGVRFVVFDKQNTLGAYLDLKRALEDETFDCLLHMQLAFRANLASLFIKARRKIGFDKQSAKELHSLFMKEQIVPAQQPHVLDGFRQFARAIGAEMTTPQWQMPISSQDEDWALQQFGSHQKRFVICAAASKTERNWLPERYAALADYAAAQGFQVYLCGGPTPSEQQLAADIESYCQTSAVNLVGKTSLKQLLALLKHASLVLAPDTGPAHMAVTVGTPVIGLYGHSNPDRTGPYIYRQYVVEVYHQALLEQYGKTAAQLKWGTRVKGEHIMQLITVDAVKQMFDRVVQEQQL
ncbi:glycosyltransferase family 9 protein [Chromatiaceae bacterium AAb-1]|nr:glycosyltransferase family 9 protein [Chromatiaceae bacterium AAb-1]